MEKAAVLRDLFSLLPAHAGVIRFYPTVTDSEGPTPRACGGDPRDDAIVQRRELYSPHMRG